MNRRNFITKAALGVAFFKPLTIWGKQNNSVGLTMEQWHTVIDYARWCPTVHNLQAHRIKITSAHTAELYYDSNRLLPVGDPESIFSRVALGIFIENLSIASAPYGKGIAIEEIVHKNDFSEKGLVHFANLRLEKNSYSNEIDRELILKRRTARGQYKGDVMDQTTMENVASEASSFNHEFKWSSDDPFVDFMVNVNQETLFEDLKNKEFCSELDRLFRYNKKTARLKKDGLSAKCMGFPGKLLRSVFRKPQRWTKGFRRKILKKRFMKTFKGTQTIGWFTGKFETTEELVQAGRLFARAWLRITEKGGYIHPFGSLITNKTAYNKMRKELNIESDDHQLWLIFRMGYSDLPARSERLDLETILLK